MRRARAMSVGLGAVRFIGSTLARRRRQHNLDFGRVCYRSEKCACQLSGCGAARRLGRARFPVKSVALAR
jgi:hypothetical protein